MTSLRVDCLHSDAQVSLKNMRWDQEIGNYGPDAVRAYRDECIEETIAGETRLIVFELGQIGHVQFAFCKHEGQSMLFERARCTRFVPVQGFGHQ